jgi:hypothetical protein
MVAAATPAPAVVVHDNFSFGGFSIPSEKSWSISVHNDTKGKSAGYVEWRGNGDLLIAHDRLADGYGIEAHLSTGRVASTAGQSSPVTVEKPGNLTENRSYEMWVCVVKGSFERCCSKTGVRP